MKNRFPAAFRRLCVETCAILFWIFSASCQPPSGGCVLKLLLFLMPRSMPFPAAFRRLCVETDQHTAIRLWVIQPPSGGCVLKLSHGNGGSCGGYQPPSGGCVLKPFGGCPRPVRASQPPSGGCVLKLFRHLSNHIPIQPAAFRRLCVETMSRIICAFKFLTSRLQAAVC